jgi:hypothetical protein
MLKRLDFAATEARAADMTDAELSFARKDAGEAAEVWDPPDPRLREALADVDPDGNAGYYRDEASVYAREQARRKFREIREK